MSRYDVLLVGMNGEAKDTMKFVYHCHKAEEIGKDAYRFTHAADAREAKDMLDDVKYLVIGGKSEEDVMETARALKAKTSAKAFSTVPLPNTPGSEKDIFIECYINPEDLDWDTNVRRAITDYRPSMGLASTEECRPADTEALPEPGYVFTSAGPEPRETPESERRARAGKAETHRGLTPEQIRVSMMKQNGDWI